MSDLSMTAARQYADRPKDERFGSLADLIANAQHDRTYSREVSYNCKDLRAIVLISCGLTVDENLTRRSLQKLQRAGRLQPIDRDTWNHSSCQSRCVRRGDDRCQW